MKGKATKRALISSAVSILLCVAMLIGTTFAWFTDTASTAVNKIQSGTLDVALEYATEWDASGNPTKWTSAEGATLEFEKAKGGEEQDILWEPGCTYELPELRIVNNDNLALKYKIVVSGITGNAKLNEAIEWTMKLDGVSETLGTEHSLAAKTGEEGPANVFTISGHMKEEAGNEYQGLSIDGIGITVYATQDTVEYDSTSNDYDENALYDIKINESANGNLPVTQEEGKEALVETETVISSGTVSVTYPEGVKLKTQTTVDGTTEKKATVEQKLEYVDSTPSTGVSIEADTQAVAQYELTLPVAEDNDVLVPIELKYEKGLTGVKIFHSGKELTTTASNTDEYFTYDSQTGTLVLYLKHASKIDIVYDKPVLTCVTIGGIAGVDKSYGTAQEAYEAVKAMLTEKLGENALKEASMNKTDFDAFFTDGGKITWTIYGNQKVTDTRMFSFGRAAGRFGDDLYITEIDIVAGNSSAALDLSSVNGTFALPYNWWNVGDNTALKCKGIIFNGIQSMPGATYTNGSEPAVYEFDDCTFNGNLYSYQNYDVNMTIKNCKFNAPADTQYAFMSQGNGGTITLDNNIFKNYTRGINLQRPTTDFAFTNNTIVSTVSEPDRQAIQLTDGKSFVVNNNKIDVNAGNAFCFHSAATNTNVTYTISNNDIKAPYIGYYATSFNVNEKITSSGNKFNNTDTTKCMKKEATAAEATNLTAIK